MKDLNKFMDRTFELIIDNPSPTPRFGYWKNFNSKYETDYDTLKRFKKMTKYQLQPLINDGKFSEVDEYVMSFNPSKKQFDLLQAVLNQELALKEKYKEGIRYLLKAKDLFENAQLDSFSGVVLIIKSGFFTPQQIKESKIKGNVIYESVSSSKIINLLKLFLFMKIFTRILNLTIIIK